jgi:hypothetical protein
VGLVFDWGGFGGEVSLPAAAPTARIMAAWGIAPGVLATPSQALKGRNNVCRPFRARVVFGYLPGAMPQAVVRSPVGAGF